MPSYAAPVYRRRHDGRSGVTSQDDSTETIPVAARNDRRSRYAGAFCLAVLPLTVHGTPEWQCEPSNNGLGWACRDDGGETVQTVTGPAYRTHGPGVGATTSSVNPPAAVAPAATPSAPGLTERNIPVAPPADPPIASAPLPLKPDPVQEQPHRSVDPASDTAPVATIPTAAETAPIAVRTTSPPLDLSRLDKGLTWEYCGRRHAKLGRMVAPELPTRDTPIELSADSIELDQRADVVPLTGSIEAQRGSQQLEADLMRYYRQTEQLHAEGGALLSQPGLRILGGEGDFDLQKNTGTLRDVHYRLLGTVNARGSAEEAELVDASVSRYRGITYSTCRPGERDWELQAEAMEIDRESGTGEARHATLRVAGVPVLYSPYLSFPLDSRRKSGFLLPSVGTSTSTGFDLTIPYYLNLAPDRDAALLPRYMCKRGLMLGGEFRYLTEHHKGELQGEILPQDAGDEDKTRGAFRFVDRGALSGNWSTDVAYNYVSDSTYLQDFGNNLEITSARNLEQRGDLVFSGQDLYFRGRLQDFLTVDSTLPSAERPYARLPQMLLLYDRPQAWSGLDMGLGAEYDYFDHRRKVHGQRLSLQPYVSWPLRQSYGALEPRLTLNHSSYSLIDELPGQPNTPTHTIATASLDGTLVLERPLDWFGADLTQTLEPRIFYLYTPYENQNDAPVFDSADLDVSFANLFRENRFSGRDRIGDANQLTLGLTTRGLSNASGGELYRASIGQILFFEDRRVQINRPVQDSPTSPFVGEVAARLLEDWSGRASLAWDPDTEGEKTVKKALQIRYQTPHNQIVNAAYRYNLDPGPVTPQQDTSYEDTDLSFRWPVNSQVELVGRWYYSLLYDETMEAFAGIEYGHCCWRVRAIARRYKNKPGEDLNNSFLLQVELAGLGEFGQRVDRFLERGIYGYRSE